MRRVTLPSCDETVSAIVARPANPSTRPAVVLALQQTGELGALEVMGLGGDPNMAFGRVFLDAGFHVVAPDLFTSGINYDPGVGWDTKRFYDRYPRWSALGRMVADHRTLITALPELIGAEPRCLIVVGHSIGGHNALFLSAFDSRVDITISSAGFERFATDKNAERWSRSSWFIGLPKMRSYLLDKASPLPWDFDDIIRLIAPRPLMVVQGRADPEVSHVASVAEIGRAFERDYSARGQPDRFAIRIFEGGHEFPPALQREAVAFALKHCPR